MKRLLLLSLWLLLSCSQSDDGPISIYPDDFALNGYGYVLSAQLDSGRRFHLYGDSFALSLDSMWTFGNCFLKNIELNLQYPNDTVATIQVKLALGNTGKTDCPQPFFRPDTVLQIAFPDSWKKRNIREIRVEGNAHNELFAENVDTSAAASATFKDSILVRRGTLQAESLSVYLDSAFDDPYALPRRTFDEKTGVLAVNDSIQVDSFAYRFVQAKCLEIHDSCETIPDTIWNISWRLKDTNAVSIRAVCADTSSDSLVFCLSKNWEVDSSSFEDSVRLRLDTTWFNSKYFVRQIPRCAALQEGDFSGNASAGRFFNAKYVLFIPSAEESGCGPAALSEWIFYSLTQNKEMLDSAQAEGLRLAWKNASIGHEEEKE